MIDPKKTKPSVFYFDDEAALLDIFQEMFEAEYDIRTTTKLAEARRMLADCADEIIISDQSMPEISGSDFLREAAENVPAAFASCSRATPSSATCTTRSSTG